MFRTMVHLFLCEQGLDQLTNLKKLSLPVDTLLIKFALYDLVTYYVIRNSPTG